MIEGCIEGTGIPDPTGFEGRGALPPPIIEGEAVGYAMPLHSASRQPLRVGLGGAPPPMTEGMTDGMGIPDPAGFEGRGMLPPPIMDGLGMAIELQLGPTQPVMDGLGTSPPPMIEGMTEGEGMLPDPMASEGRFMEGIPPEGRPIDGLGITADSQSAPTQPVTDGLAPPKGVEMARAGLVKVMEVGEPFSPQSLQRVTEVVKPGSMAPGVCSSGQTSVVMVVWMVVRPPVGWRSTYEVVMVVGTMFFEGTAMDGAPLGRANESDGLTSLETGADPTGEAPEIIGVGVGKKDPEKIGVFTPPLGWDGAG
ncbi:hypothetical protein IWZ01DRAFT_512809 [Phyllosticta capitalensis]